MSIAAAAAANANDGDQYGHGIFCGGVLCSAAAPDAANGCTQPNTVTGW